MRTNRLVSLGRVVEAVGDAVCDDSRFSSAATGASKISTRVLRVTSVARISSSVVVPGTCRARRVCTWIPVTSSSTTSTLPPQRTSSAPYSVANQNVATRMKLSHGSADVQVSSASAWSSALSHG